MCSAFSKTTLREIKNSLGRYLAILAIIALGVGFFSGLKVSQSAMVKTGDKYTGEYNLFDYRLISTLGFSKEDVQKIASEFPEAKTVAGGLSEDFIYMRDSVEYVIKAHSVTPGVNDLKLCAGKLPTADNECVGDSRFFREEQIGSVITVEEKSEDSLLKYDEYTLTGLVSSPYYLNFERGTTSLKNGSLSAFVYIPEDGWDFEYYTEILFKLADTGYLFSEEYNDTVSPYESRLTDRVEALTADRYDELVNHSLDDAKETYNTSLSEYNDQVQKAEQEISRANEELDKAKAELDSAKTELDTSRTALEQQEIELNGKLDEIKAGLAQVDAAKQSPDYLDPAFSAQIDAKERELKAAQAQVQKGLYVLQEKKAEWETGQAEYEAGFSKYESEKQTVGEKAEDARKELEKAKQELDDAATEIAEAETELSKIKKPVCYVLGRDTNIGYACFDSDSQIVDGIANVFPVFFFLVAALVCMTTMTRMVDDHRTQIGVLKSLGYGKAVIIGKYIIYSGSAAAIGCIAGFLIGSMTIPRIIWTVYDIMYGFAPLETVFDPLLAVISLAVSLLCSVGSTLAACFMVFSNVPAQLIRPTAPKAGKRVFLEHIPFVWKRLKFLHKVSVRNILRYKKRFIMMVLGIGGCTALLLTGFGIRDSIRNIAVFQFDEIEVFDGSVSFINPTDAQTADTFCKENTDSISEMLLLYESSVTVSTDKMSKSVKLRVPNKTDLSGFVNLHDADSSIDFPKIGCAVINKSLAELLNVTAGDTVMLADGSERRMQVTVSGVFDNYVYNYMYISADTYEQGFGECPQFKTAFVNFAQDSDVRQAAARLSEDDQIASISVNQDMRDRVSSMLSSLDYIVLLVIVCAGALAFIVLYNLTNINITERIREIATIKVLGFRPLETASYVYRENLILTVIGALLGLPLGNALLAYVIAQIKIDMVSFDTIISTASYLFSIILTFAFTALVSILLYFKLQKINMAESLKSIE